MVLEGNCEKKIKLKFKMTASDMFSSVEDYLEINVSIIPFSTYLYYTMIIVFPFFAIIGIIKYRSVWYNLFFKEYYY